MVIFYNDRLMDSMLNKKTRDQQTSSKDNSNSVLATGLLVNCPEKHMYKKPLGSQTGLMAFTEGVQR